MKNTLEPSRGNNRFMSPSRLFPFSNRFRDFDDLINDMSILSPFLSHESRDMMLEPLCDICETDSAYQVSLDIPGLKKEDINIEVSGNQLMISGERREDRESGKEGTRSYMSERRFGRFERSFTLPNDIEVNKVVANFDNGVLEVSIPKAQESRRSRISISEGQQHRQSQVNAAPQTEAARQSQLNSSVGGRSESSRTTPRA